MELTQSFLDLLAHFRSAFTKPTFRTFSQICSGWVLSHRHRYITDVIFSSGNVAKGHWARFHRFFSDAAWDLDFLNMCLALLVARILCPTGTLLLAVDDTLCRKRGLTIYGTGMHHDPLISSRAKPLVSWGHDWVVLCIIIVHPFWAPTKVCMNRRHRRPPLNAEARHARKANACPAWLSEPRTTPSRGKN